MRDEDLNDKSIRPLVRKHYRTFEGYVRHHGADMIRELLDKGRTGKYRLTLLSNRKDRYQMMQLLDLIKEKKDGGESHQLEGN